MSVASPKPNGMLTRSMVERISRATRFDEAIGILLDDLIALLGAVYGNVQLASGDDLVIVAQRGFAKDFLAAFRHVRISDGSSVCARSARARRSVVVSDVEIDPEFASLRGLAEKAGYRAVQSTPLITGPGALIGVLSTHFRAVHAPTPIEMQTLKEYSAAAADHLYALLDGTSLPAKAAEMNGALFQAS